jgi:hypothetical protein
MHVSVHNACIETKQYTFRMETADYNSTVFHSYDSMNQLCNQCQAFHFKAGSPAGYFTSITMVWFTSTSHKLIISLRNVVFFTLISIKECEQIYTFGDLSFLKQQSGDMHTDKFSKINANSSNLKVTG